MRRHGLVVVAALAIAVAACTGGGASDDASTSATPTTSVPTPSPSPTLPGPADVRLVTANLTSGNNQNWNGGEGKRILEGTHPDVVLIQEWNVGAEADADLRAFVDSAFGPSFSYVREPETTGGIPNGVISRWPLLGSGVIPDPQVANRSFVWARIDIPGSKDLVAVSVHLLTSNASERDLEAQALLGALPAIAGSNDYLAIAGDFNTGVPANEPLLTTLAPAVVTTTAGLPADQSGNITTNGPRSKHYDWILTNPSLTSLQTALVVGTSSYPNGLVIDTRVYQPIEDLAPALATDSAATGMQHMAVIRQFHTP